MKKQFAVYVSETDYGILEAEDKNDLQQKILTGKYGMLPIRGRDFIRYTPQTIKKVIEILETNQ